MTQVADSLHNNLEPSLVKESCGKHFEGERMIRKIKRTALVFGFMGIGFGCSDASKLLENYEANQRQQDGISDDEESYLLSEVDGLEDMYLYLEEDASTLEDEADIPKNHPIFDGLSDEAVAIHENVKAIKDGFHTEREALCSQDGSLMQSIQASITEIRDNETLSREEKRDLVRDLVDSNKESVKADRDLFHDCLETNKDALAVIDTKDRELSDACLIRGPMQKGNDPMGTGPEGRGHKKGPKGKIGGQGFDKNGGKGKNMQGGSHEKAIPARMIEDLETKLTSNECTAVVEQY